MFFLFYSQELSIFHGVVFIYLIPFRSIITTDKVFILLLVILLPLTGCLDAIDNADAENPSSEPVAETTPDVYSLNLLAYNTATITLDGDSTLKLESIFSHRLNRVLSSGSWIIGFNMTCNDTTIISYATFSDDEFVPFLGGQLCTLEIRTAEDYILTFSKHSLASL